MWEFNVYSQKFRVVGGGGGGGVAKMKRLFARAIATRLFAQNLFFLRLRKWVHNNYNDKAVVSYLSDCS